MQRIKGGGSSLPLLSGIVLPLIFFAAATHPAHAAHWAGPTYQVSGSTATYDSATDSTNNTNPWTVSNYEGEQYFNVYAQPWVYPNGAASATASGTVDIIFTWVADYGDTLPLANPTAPVDILVTGEATAS